MNSSVLTEQMNITLRASWLTSPGSVFHQMNVAIDAILDMWFGESERKLADVFARARDDAPSVMFFDEVEAIGANRQQIKHSPGRSLVNQLLAQLDGLSGANDKLLVMATLIWSSPVLLAPTWKVPPVPAAAVTAPRFVSARKVSAPFSASTKVSPLARPSTLISKVEPAPADAEVTLTLSA